MRRILVAAALAAVGLMPMPATGQTAPTCFDKTVTILGTEGSDDLRGTEGSDVMHGLGGGDQMMGTGVSEARDGRDWMCGGDGDDIMRGEAGHDFMDGGLNTDNLRGGPGNDKLFGGPGPDYLADERWGADHVNGGLDNDELTNFDDQLQHPNGDTFLGGHGNDVVLMVRRQPLVKGQAWGKDVIRGGTGDDELWGTWTPFLGSEHKHEAPGNEDTVDGGSGIDTCYVNLDDTVVNCEHVIVVG